MRRRRAGRPKVRESSVRIIATRLYSRAKVTGTGTPLELPRFVPSKVRCVVLGAMICVAFQTAPAQETPLSRPVFSIGQPSRWQLYLDAMVQNGGASGADALAVAGTEQSLFNPVVGLLAGDAELYGYAGSGRAEAGARGIVRSPALALGVGLDWNFTRGRGDLLLTYRSAILRGGLLGRGTMLRVDWMPTREQTVAIGLHIPIAQPLAGKTRPRHIDAFLPAAKPQRGTAPLSADIELTVRQLMPQRRSLPHVRASGLAKAFAW